MVYYGALQFVVAVLIHWRGFLTKLTGSRGCVTE
mgnify:FL=1